MPSCAASPFARPFLLATLSELAPEAQREHAGERRAPADLVAILPVERAREPGRLLRGAVLLLAADGAAALTRPPHRPALGAEAVAVPVDTAADHGIER